jgi:hypothetical protein
MRVQVAHPQWHGKWELLLPGYGNDYVWANYPKPEETADEFYAPFRVLVDPTGRSGDSPANRDAARRRRFADSGEHLPPLRVGPLV